MTTDRKQIGCTEINKLFVEIFHSLAEKEEDTQKFNKLAKIFGTLTLNEKLLLKFSTNWQKHKDNIGDMVYFKNTSFKTVFDKFEPNEQNLLKNKLETIYDLSQQELKNCFLETKKNLMKNLFENKHLQNLLSNANNNNKNTPFGNFDLKKIQQFMKNNEKLFENMKKHYEETSKKSINKEGEIDDNSITQLQSLLMNLFKENKTFLNILSTAFDKKMFKEIFKKLFGYICKTNKNENGDDDNENNEQGNDKINEIFEKIQQRILNEHPEIMEDIEEITKIFDKDKLESVFENAQKYFNQINPNDPKSILNFIKKYLDEDPSIQNLLWKAHMTFESGLINLDKMKKHAKIVSEIALQEFSNSEFISNDQCKTLFNMFFKNRKKKDKNDDSGKNATNKRKERRIKKNRRLIRQQLKKNKKK